MRKNDLQYMEGFQDELKSFIGRVKDRAQARIDKAMKEYEEVNEIFLISKTDLEVKKINDKWPILQYKRKQFNHTKLYTSFSNFHRRSFRFANTKLHYLFR